MSFQFIKHNLVPRFVGEFCFSAQSVDGAEHTRFADVKFL